MFIKENKKLYSVSTNITLCEYTRHMTKFTKYNMVIAICIILMIFELIVTMNNLVVSSNLLNRSISNNRLKIIMHWKYIFRSYSHFKIAITERSHILFGFLLMIFCNLSTIIGIFFRCNILLFPWLLYYFTGERLE